MAKTNRLESPAAPKQQDNQATIMMNPPPVRVRIPEIKIPEIKIPAINVPETKVDTSGIAQAVSQLGSAIAAISQQQTAVLQQMAETNKLLEQLAGNDSHVKGEPAIIVLPARSRRFTVDVEDGDG